MQISSMTYVVPAGETQAAEAPARPATLSVAADRDRVTLSKQGLALAKRVQDSKTPDEEESAVDKILKRIRDVQGKIRELEASDLPEGEKRRRMQALQTELSSLMQELASASAESGASSTGGTRAQGFAASLT